MLRRRLVIAGIVGAALLTACADVASPSGSAPEPTEAVAPDAPSVAAPSLPETPVDDEHPLAFDARLLDGGAFDASQFVGQPVALWMWAPW